MTDITINFRSETAIYTQIVEQVQKHVMSGLLKPGDQLPTVRQLATELRVNFNTVARAYRILDDLGLISTQQGRGTYIWEPENPEAAEVRRQRTLQQITRNYLSDAAALGFSADEIKAEIELNFQQIATTVNESMDPKDTQ